MTTLIRSHALDDTLLLQCGNMFFYGTITDPDLLRELSAIPYSLWRNNALWNLFPAHKRVNSEKRDRLPERTFLKSRESRIREYWDMCSETEPLLFRKEIRSLTGTPAFNKEISRGIFKKFCEQVEILALQNVVERWKV